MQIKILIFYIMGENAICTKQTEEDEGGNIKGKSHLKRTFQPYMYFGDFYGGTSTEVERELEIYFKKKGK